MSTRVEVEDIESTKSEKLLAVVLAVFLLIGGIWAYQRIDDWARAAVDYETSPADRRALERNGLAEAALARADEAEDRAEEQLVLAREAYRTALDANRPVLELEEAYERARARHERAETAFTAAMRTAEATRPAAQAAAQRREQGLADLEDRRALVGFLLRLAFTVAFLGAAYATLGRLRQRGSRSLPLALAFVGAGALLALVLAGDYLTDYFDPLDLGPLVLALVGIALTLAAFAALQRYLARRVPVRRVRRHECPFCGYPVRDNARCEGCGRPAVGECTNCAEPRRVGALHCGVCGHA